MKELMKTINYHFRDKSLLEMALRHPSLGGKDNQRLEFLGDAILEYLMSERLYNAYPKEREGGLTHRRARLVCEATLSDIARQINLGRYLKLDKGEEQTNGREKDSILADSVEALLAAVYLDGGIENARALLIRLFPTLETVSARTIDYKGLLQEHLQASSIPSPQYEVIDIQGPPHDRLFTTAVISENVPLGKGQGKTKKQAEQEAAKQAYQQLCKGGSPLYEAKKA